MGRTPCCSKEGLTRGAWTVLEDQILTDYIKTHGEGKWAKIPRQAGLNRCGKSCRLRWMNYLRPNIKRGNISPEEEDLIIRLHKLLGNRWSLIAGRLPGRTDNEIKNYWNTTLGKKVRGEQSKQSENEDKKTKLKLSNKTPLPNMIESNAIRPKAIRTKASTFTEVPVAVNQTPTEDKMDSKVVTEAHAHGELVSNKDVGSKTSGTMTSSVTSEDINLQDFALDFCDGEFLLFDIADSEFWKQSMLDHGSEDVGYSGAARSKWPSLDQPDLMFSEELMLKDWIKYGSRHQT